MAEIPDVIPGELITADYNNDMRDRSLQRYASTVDRDADNPVPVDGDLAFLQTSPTTGDIVQVFSDGAWVALIDSTGGTMTAGSLALEENIAITFDYDAGTGFNVTIPTGSMGELQVRRGVSTWMAFRQDPVNQVFINHELEMDATVSLIDGNGVNPGIRFRDDPDTGFYRSAPNDIRITAGGAERMSWRATGVGSQTIYDNTTTTAANVNIVGTTFLLRRSTASSAAYKENIRTLEAAEAASVIDQLRPVVFRSVLPGDPEEDQWGFIAEETNDAFPIYDTGDTYDTNAVLAALWAAVKDLRIRVGALE